MDKNNNGYNNIITELKSKKRTTLSIILIGAGLAGLIDIGFFHLILQSHHSMSNIVSPNVVESLKINIVGDGLFIVLSTIFLVTGFVLLKKDYTASLKNNTETSLILSKKFFTGLLLIGFGLFNVIEGIIDHHILGIHHVIETTDPLGWDLLFLFVGGFLFIGIGIIILMKKTQDKV